MVDDTFHAKELLSSLDFWKEAESDDVDLILLRNNTSRKMNDMQNHSSLKYVEEHSLYSRSMQHIFFTIYTNIYVRPHKSLRSVGLALWNSVRNDHEIVCKLY
jgi:hypothetical protein